MITIEETKIHGFEEAVRGMRNPMNSWDKSDSHKCIYSGDYKSCTNNCVNDFVVGEKDHDLMLKLAKTGPVDGKFRRMITVSLDITAPLYWWKEFDTYKVGTVANSCSTMHKIHAKEFTLDDFSHEHLDIYSMNVLETVVETLNKYRDAYNNYNPDDFEIKGCPSKKDIWWQMIQLLPSSYNQRRTVLLNYEVLSNIYKHRKDHKLDEWRLFCEWIETLPYADVIFA